MGTTDFWRPQTAVAITGLVLLLVLAGCQSKNRTVGQQTMSDSAFQNQRLAQLTDSIEKFPDSAHFYFERGALHFVTENYPDAKSDLKKAILLNPMESLYYTALGQLFFSQDIFDSAVANFQKAVKVAPDNKRARLQLAFGLFKQARYTLALQQTDSLLQLDSELTRAMGLQSQIYEALGDTAHALMVMKKVIALPPVSYDAWMRMGDLLLAQGSEDALIYYKKAAAKDSTAAEPYYCMGLLYEKQGKPDSATKAFGRSIVKDPNYVDAYLRLGGLYERDKNWEKAEKIYTLAIKMSPANGDAYYHRGLAFEHLQNKEAAAQDYQQALIFDSDNQSARDALKRVQP